MASTLVAEGGEGPTAWQVTVDPDGSLCVGPAGRQELLGSPAGARAFTVDNDAAPTIVAGSAPGATTVKVLDAHAVAAGSTSPVKVDGTRLLRGDGAR